jgi:hypothetical protein
MCTSLDINPASKQIIIDYDNVEAFSLNPLDYLEKFGITA